MKLKNIRPRQVVIASLLVLAIMFVIKNARIGEKYEGETGPSAMGPSVETTITQQELDAIMKFIKR